MRPDALNRVVAAVYFGDDGVVIVGVEPSAVAYLSAGLGVERRVIENDLAFFAGVELLHTLTVGNNRQHLAAIRARLAIALEDRGRQLLVGGIRGLFGRAFPGSAGSLALLVHRRIEALLIEFDALIAAASCMKSSGMPKVS